MQYYFLGGVSTSSRLFLELFVWCDLTFDEIHQGILYNMNMSLQYFILKTLNICKQYLLSLYLKFSTVSTIMDQKTMDQIILGHYGTNRSSFAELINLDVKEFGYQSGSNNNLLICSLNRSIRRFSYSQYFQKGMTRRKDLQKFY